MKFFDCFIRFGPNLIFNGESTEGLSFGNDIENRLSLGRSSGRQLFNFWRYYYPVLRQQTRSADYDALAVYACLCPPTWLRCEVHSLQRGQISALGFGYDCVSERVFGVGFDSSSISKQITLVVAGRGRDS
jgi:hypothetical protein